MTLQITDFFHTTQKVKTQQVDRTRFVPDRLDLWSSMWGPWVDYLPRGGGSGVLVVTDKIRQYHTGHTMIIIIVPRILSPLCVSLLVRLSVYIVNLCVFYFYRLIGKLTVVFSSSGVHVVKSNQTQFHYRRVVFSSQLKSKVSNAGSLHFLQR